MTLEQLQSGHIITTPSISGLIAVPDGPMWVINRDGTEPQMLHTFERRPDHWAPVYPLCINSSSAITRSASSSRAKIKNETKKSLLSAIPLNTK